MGVHGDQGANQTNEGGAHNRGPERRHPTKWAVGSGPADEPTPQGDSNPVRPPPASGANVEAHLQDDRPPEVIHVAEQPISQWLDPNYQGGNGGRSQNKPDELPPIATACHYPETG